MHTMSLTEMIDRYEGHFFDRETMSFFNSKVYGDCVYSLDGIAYYFVTSEKPIDQDRRYTLRAYDKKENTILTVSKYCEFKTKQQADKALKRILNL